MCHRCLCLLQGIYDSAHWGNDGGGSGEGSSLAYTAKMRPKLTALLTKLGIKHLYDAPCGAMVWMPRVLEEMEKASPGFKYTGYDVACNVISRVQGTYMQRPNWSFACVDVSQSFPVAKGEDLDHSAIFSRDALQHLDQARTRAILANFKASGVRYLIVGSYLNAKGANVDIKAGEYYPINLLEPPFNLRPKPVEVIDEETPDGKFLLVLDARKMQWDN